MQRSGFVALLTDHTEKGNVNLNSETQFIARSVQDNILFIKKIYGANNKYAHHRCDNFAPRNYTLLCKSTHNVFRTRPDHPVRPVELGTG